MSVVVGYVPDATGFLAVSEAVQQARWRGSDVSDVILEIAEEIGAELVVVGLHRRSPVRKALLGSTAQRVLLEATCPVLAVRAPSTS